MIYPNKSKPFHLFTDASNYTWSTALMQMDDNTPEMVTPPSSSEKKGEDPSPQQMEKDKPPYAWIHHLSKWKKTSPPMLFSKVSLLKQLSIIVAVFRAPNWHGQLLLRRVSVSLKAF